MNVSRSLTFLWTPVSLAVSIIAVLAAAGVCFVAVRRSGYRRSLVLLEMLRFGIVCVAVLLFNQPEWIEEFRPEGKPSVAVLWDGSPSMETRDVVLPGRVGHRSDRSARSDLRADHSRFLGRLAGANGCARRRVRLRETRARHEPV